MEEIIDNDIINKIRENTKTKLINNITKLKEKGYSLLSFDITGFLSKDWKWAQAEYLCHEHGIFFATGIDIRTLTGCPKCNEQKNQKLIDLYNKSNQEAREKLLKSNFSNIDWSEVKSNEFLDLDHNIRPDCIEHGEFITTPRKLFNGDKCKWCDGTKFNEESNEYNYKLSRDEFFKEKMSIVYDRPIQDISIIGYNKFYIKNVEQNSISGSIPEVKANDNYIEHLKEVRDPSKWNYILFKINVMDKSSKFQFSIVSTLNLNENWMKWYNTKIEENDDFEVAQKQTMDILLSTWFNTLFYNKQISDSKDPFQYEIIWSFWSNAKRIESLYYKYRNTNESKLLILPSALQEKIYYNLEEVKVNCYWSDTKWESTSNSVSLIRETLLNKNKICPICKKPINKPVVDHEHKKRVRGTGRIRDNICSNCNVFIAKAENNCTRYGIILEELPEVLKNVSDYFTTQQYPIIHYTDKDARPTLSKNLANKVLKYWDCIRPGKKKLKIPRSGILTKDWEEAVKDYENYMKNPAKSFSKNDYKTLLRQIEIYNAVASTKNSTLPKTKKINLILIPEYPKLKIVTPEIQRLLDITKV